VGEVVERFIDENTLDERAGDALRACHPQVQQAVLDRGNLVGARNPSSVLLARIRDETKGDHGGAPNGVQDGGRRYDHATGAGSSRCISVPDALIDDVETFLRAQPRGDRAAADLLARIEEARRGIPDPRYEGGLPSSEQTNESVEAFLRDNPVDEKAADRLRSCDPHTQQVVMDKGIHTARNPSSALLARIRDTEGARMQSGDGRGPPGGYDRGQDRGYDREYDRGDDRGYDRAYDRGYDDRGYDDRAYGRGYDRGDDRRDHRSGGYDRRGLAGGYDRRDSSRGDHRGEMRRGREHPDDGVEAFLKSNPVDARAADALRQCDPEVQREVMRLGIAGARNPSSALSARIRNVEEAQRGYGRGDERRNAGRDRYSPY
jgi:hypothetical protein